MCTPFPLTMWTDSPRIVDHQIKIPGKTAIIKRMFRIIYINHLRDDDNIREYMKINKNKNKKVKNMKLENELIFEMIKENYLKIMS